MKGDEARAAACLDGYLDALVRGGRPVEGGLDPGLRATVGRVHARPVAPAPDAAYAERLWRELAASGPAGRGVGRSAVVGSLGFVPWSLAGRGSGASVRLRGSRALANLATAAVVLVTLVGSMALARPAPPPSGSGAATPFDLFRVDLSGFPGDEQYVVLDPVTLADAREVEPFDIAARASADGSTIVTVETAGEWSGYEYVNMPAEAVTITVRDARTGAERSRFHPPRAPVNALSLSRDGSRLLAVSPPEAILAEGEIPTAFGPGVCRGVMCIDSDPPPDPPEVAGYLPPRWYVFETATGRLLATWEGLTEGWNGSEWVVDAALQRLYHLAATPVEIVGNRYVGLDEPQPVELVARDLATGVEAGRLHLPGVLGGSWLSAEDGADVHLGPGLALSPDGRRLAIVHADEEAVTLIDAQSLAVEETLTLKRPVDLLDRLASLLPLVPRSAAAKGPSGGVGRNAVFAPDGHHLYVHGWESGVDAGSNQQDYDGPGLMVVDLRDGSIVAEAFPGALVSALLPTPDGRELYVLMRDDTWSGAAMYLRRLDATTLATLAERGLSQRSQFVWRPGDRAAG